MQYEDVDIYSDNQLMLKVKSGDVGKLGMLYERYKKKLFGFFYKMNKDPAISEDLVQTVFIKMLNSRHTYNDSGKFSSWMYRIATNVNADHYRKPAMLLEEDINQSEKKAPCTASNEEILGKQETMNLLKQAIGRLDPAKRELLILSRFQKLKYKEIADIFNTSESAVKMKASRVIAELTETYLKLEGGDGYES